MCNFGKTVGIGDAFGRCDSKMERVQTDSSVRQPAVGHGTAFLASDTGHVSDLLRLACWSQRRRLVLSPILRSTTGMGIDSINVAKDFVVVIQRCTRLRHEGRSGCGLRGKFDHGPSRFHEYWHQFTTAKEDQSNRTGQLGQGQGNASRYRARAIENTCLHGK